MATNASKEEVKQMDKRISILEARVDRLEKAFKFYLQAEKKSLRFLRKIVSDFKRVTGL